MRSEKIVSLLAALALSATAIGQTSRKPPAHSQKPPQGPNFADLAAAVFTPGPAPNPAAVARGQKLFAPTCGFCHGPDGTGRSGPDLVSASVVIRDHNGNLIGPIVRRGFPAQGMPAFTSLTNAQISDISAFLHARIRAAANRFAYSMKAVVTGNAKAGEAYFNGAGKCDTCHSPTGDLAGIARRFQPAQLQAHMIYPGPSYFGGGGGKPVPPTTVTVRLPSGRTVSGTLIALDHFRLALRDASGWYRSFPVKGAIVRTHDPLAAHKQLVMTITDPEMHNLLAYLETLK